MSEKKLGKSEIIDAIARDKEVAHFHTTKADINRVIDAFTKLVAESLANDVEVSLTGFGKFETRYRDKRSGRNPQTGDKIMIPAKYVPAFKAGKDLKRAVVESHDDKKKAK